MEPVYLYPHKASCKPHTRVCYRPVREGATNSRFMLDVMLNGGLIVDGSGEAPFVTDIALVGDRVVRIGDCAGTEALLQLDCRGLAVAPGFIDMHSHSDEVLLVLPSAESKVRQGITTEVGGNCGFSPAPLLGGALDEKRDEMRRLYGGEPEWTDFDGFFRALEQSPPALNFCCLAGLGTIRSALGCLGPHPLRDDDLMRAQALVRQACEQGAIGVSSGLIYPPGRSADTDELVALASSAAAAGSPLYASHIRSEGDGLIEAVDEALDVGRRSECAVQLSHHKASRRRNWGKVHDTLARIDRARDSGLDVVVDQYPYKASSTGLDVILPGDVNVGTRAEVAARLADPRYAALVAARVELDYGGRWHEVLVASVGSHKNRHYEGQTLADIAASMGRTPVDAALRLLVDEKLDVAAIYFTMCEDDVRTVLSYRHTCIGTDASARATGGPTAIGKPHPRTFGTFPRIFKRYVRDTKLLTLAEAVRRATSLPASRLGLRDRGAIAVGSFADVVVFDAERIADTATYAQPYCYPQGIVHVFVNGVAAVRDGAMTVGRPGRVLRKGRDL
jgi:N-acyl-D-aspartate/D-glutamate deacylase